MALPKRSLVLLAALLISTGTAFFLSRLKHVTVHKKERAVARHAEASAAASAAGAPRRTSPQTK
jgi:hypothetical protein